MKRQELDFKKMASLLMFDQPGFIKYVKSNGAKFRKGKNTKDINKAMEKATKNGMGKVEFEEDMLEVYLKEVFKKIGVLRSK